MKEYFVEILFRNAKVFKKNDRNTKDISYTYTDGIVSRNENIPQYDEPITVHHISNMLHVLFGKRPVPSLRHSIMKRDEKIFEMANNSFLKINTPKVLNTKTNEHYYIDEFLMTKKAQWNSWKGNVQVNWETLKRGYGERWDLYYTKLCELFNDNNLIKNYSLVDLKEKAKQFTKEDIVNHFGEEFKKGAFGVNYLIGDAGYETISRNIRGNIGYCNTNGVERYKNMSGVLLVKMTSDDLQELENNFRLPTILDGGFIKINKIKEVGYVDDNFIKVSEISTKTTLYVKPIKK